MFRERLFLAFFDWLDTNKKTIGDKWYADLYDKGKDAEASCNTIMSMMRISMWMFNVIADLGVLAGVRPNGFDLQHLKPGIDEKSSKRLLALLSSCLGLQSLPMDVMKQEVPIISYKRFSLALYVKKYGTKPPNKFPFFSVWGVNA